MTKQKPIKDSKQLYEFSRTYKRHDEMDKAKREVSYYSEITLGNYLGEFFTREFWNAPVAAHGKFMKELITGKRLKSAQKNLKHEQMLFDVANRMYQLTGAQPGETSGVVKTGKIADKKVADLLHSTKIAAAMVLAYGKDDTQKEQVMKEIESKYPEIAKEVRNLAKKAQARVKADPFKRATVGLKFGKKQDESFKINEFGEIIRGGR